LAMNQALPNSLKPFQTSLRRDDVSPTHADESKRSSARNSSSELRGQKIVRASKDRQVDYAL
jgi:hypothetical protein